ncbi:MAG TPA: cellulose binding domain-containing protein [Streptosporangiaceae bacterium]
MRPLRRPPPRHRAPSGAARLQARRAQAGQTGAEQPGPGHSEARQLEPQQPEAGLPEAQLPEAQLSEAGPSEAGLSEAGLSEAGLSEAQLPEAQLSEAGLSEAQLSEAQLSEAQLSEAGLLSEAQQPEAHQTGVGQPEVGHPGPEPPNPESADTEPLEAGQLQAGQLQAKQPRDGHVGPAFRRLMVTPTFAAGLGVVVAAGLAVSMTSRTVLHFSGPEGKPCVVRGCATGVNRSPGAGTPASASPGKRLVPATLSPENSARPSPSFTGGQGGEDSGHHSGSHVVIDYETTQRFTWGFDGKITISGLSDSALSTWQLGFSYPGTRIVEVQGAQWQSTGDDSGVAQAETSGSTGHNGSDSGHGGSGGSGQDSSGHGGQNTVVITIEASGTPGAPSDCRFDNTTCSFR